MAMGLNTQDGAKLPTRLREPKAMQCRIDDAMLQLSIKLLLKDPITQGANNEVRSPKFTRLAFVANFLLALCLIPKHKDP